MIFGFVIDSAKLRGTVESLNSPITCKNSLLENLSDLQLKLNYSDSPPDSRRMRLNIMNMKEWERLGDLLPEEKILIAIDMSETAVQVCAEGIRMQSPNMSDEELLEELRERLEWMKRCKHGV